MRQTITLLFHVGFGKTATTWMQKQIFSKIALNEDNCIYLGKLGDDEMMLDERFHKLHYELFNSLNELKRYRSTFNPPEEIAYPELKLDVDDINDYKKLLEKQYRIDMSAQQIVNLALSNGVI